MKLVFYDVTSPDSFPSVTLGYKRKEIAYVKILQDEAGENVFMPSLLSGSQLTSNNVNINGTDLTFNQVFATGKAASYMAMNPNVRNTVGMKLIPIEEQKKAMLKKEQKTLQNIMKDRLENSAELHEQALMQNDLITKIDHLTGPQALEAENRLPAPANSPAGRSTVPSVAKGLLRGRAIAYESKDDFDRVYIAVTSVM